MAADRHERDRQQERESRRILDRIARETEPGLSPLISRAVRNARDHVAAEDADPTDAVEVWGTRIGRVLGLVLAVAIMVWLAFFLINNG
ncbi:hypothetical protein [Mesorhizobium sp. SP-1A]|uniref:hypothetical protein n=1 Tax=Mesorhizobium sp. SP-1A TaxID=3077840 RepID=UPI0028F72204|nr:hypothetical protein [Mesorhizobium sp. SP-1A]